MASTAQEARIARGWFALYVESDISSGAANIRWFVYRSSNRRSDHAAQAWIRCPYILSYFSVRQSSACLYQLTACREQPQIQMDHSYRAT
ncbi:hypothetical protein MPER_12835 [Moniliophthora perniciosa FA553]|nr:hypothetical protein MPER_12835 [Moniliophthora perniciosa FA553]